VSNYLPHYTKKRQSLQRKELALRRLIDRGADSIKLAFSALEVREARVQVLRARLATVPPRCDEYGELIAQLQAKIGAERVDPGDVLREFGWTPRAGEP
jgi:hypothetical protein